MTLLNMLPRLTVYYLRNSLKAHAVLGRERVKGDNASLVTGTDIADRICREACRSVSLSAMRLWMRLTSISLSARHRLWVQPRAVLITLAGASLTRRIPIVVGRCANEQMRGVDARGVVALMADEQSLRDGANAKLVRKAMCQSLLAVFYRKRAVPVAVAVTSPDPTGAISTRAVNKRPKPRLSFGIHLASDLYWWLEDTRKRLEKQWWLEERKRQHEAGDEAYADAIDAALIEQMYTWEQE